MEEKRSQVQIKKLLSESFLYVTRTKFSSSDCHHLVDLFDLYHSNCRFKNQFQNWYQ